MLFSQRLGILIICSLLAVGTPVFADELDQLQALDESTEETEIGPLEFLGESDSQENILNIAFSEENLDDLTDTLANEDSDTMSDEPAEQELSFTFSGYVKAMAYWNRTVFSDELWNQYRQLKASGFSAPDKQKTERYNYTGVRTQLKLEGYLGDQARFFSSFNLDFNEAASSDYDEYQTTPEDNQQQTIRMVETFIELYEGNRTWKAGTQLITWSYMEGYETPTDRLNARDQTYLSSEYEDTKLPSTGVLFTQVIGDLTLELMAIPVGKVNINPSFTDYLYTGGHQSLDKTAENSKWAARFSGSVAKLDYAFSYVDGNDQRSDVNMLDADGNVMVVDSSTSSMQLLADMSTYNRPARTYHRVQSPGIDLQYNLGSWIPKMAYVQYLTEDEDGDNPFIKNNWSQYMFGGEFKITSATVNLYAGQIIIEDYKEETPLDLKTNQLLGQKRERTDILSGYINADFLPGNALNLNLMFANYWDKEGKAVESKLKSTFKYKIADGLLAYLAFSYFDIDDTEITDVQTEIKYSF